MWQPLHENTQKEGGVDRGQFGIGPQCVNEQLPSAEFS